MEQTSSAEDVSQTSSRPPSSYTNESAFADSAVQMDSATPTASNTFAESKVLHQSTILPASPEPVDQSVSDRIRQLTAAIWTLEQDESMPSERREEMHQALTGIEQLVRRAETDNDSTRMSELGSFQAQHEDRMKSNAQADNLPNPIVNNNEYDEDEWIDEADLLAVRENLAATVQSMRLRQQEQKHLHELTVQKLEAVAERCLVQEKQIQDMIKNIQELRLENRSLGQEYDRLKSVTSELETESARKEVAVEAMSSAVAGLEGWIESTPVTTPSKSLNTKRQRVVVRGKGRFRGRYVVDEHDNGDRPRESGGSEEFQEGIRAWVRGFRDVEEEFRQHSSPIPSRWREALDSQRRFDEDEWGDFESPVK